MAAAAKRGTYRANVEESIVEGMQDVRHGRLVPISNVLEVDEQAAVGSRASESALRQLDVEYDDEQKLLLGQTLSELMRRPNVGKTVDVEYLGSDYSDTMLPIRKFFSPPCDVLYGTNREGNLIVYGFVPAPFLRSACGRASDAFLREEH